MSQKRNLLTFHYTSCLIGILIMVYCNICNQCSCVVKSPIYPKNNAGLTILLGDLTIFVGQRIHRVLVASFLIDPSKQCQTWPFLRNILPLNKCGKGQLSHQKTSRAVNFLEDLARFFSRKPNNMLTHLRFWSSLYISTVGIQINLEVWCLR